MSNILRHPLSWPNRLPSEGIERVVEILNTGRMYRYNYETPDSNVALMEKELACYIGSKYAIGVNSCAKGLEIILQSMGVRRDESVLMSAFTYTAVPSAIVNIGALPVLVGCTQDYGIDCDDLSKKAKEIKARILVLSHMRGHISNMGEVTQICDKNGIDLVEDCAHSLGTKYNGKNMGLFGKAASFSMQSHKLINSGEGGIIITDDEEIYVKSVLYAGSQDDFWMRHPFANSLTNQLFAKYQEIIPNISSRMNNVTAEIIRVQLPYLDEWKVQYNKNYKKVISIISKSKYISLPSEQCTERAQDTIQFNIKEFSQEEVDLFIKRLKIKGIDAKIFGLEGSPRFYKSWKYIKGIEKVTLAKTDEILKRAVDIRLPLWLNDDEVEYIGTSIFDTIQETKR